MYKPDTHFFSILKIINEYARKAICRAFFLGVLIPPLRYGRVGQKKLSL